ncbi:MAG: hypothetical protein PWP24_1975 [Clostridiales bacterium]|nr:hypothetical protein [Clostridiales bacterium]
MRGMGRMKKVLLISWMLVIFIFSSKEAGQSNAQSYQVGEVVCTIVNPSFSTLPQQEKQETIESINYMVRKTAHFTEYTMLGLLLGLAFPNGSRYLLFEIGVAYAATDEFHQLFVSGRTPQVKDVAIDSMGVLFGLLLYCLIKQIKKQIKGS